jgi:indole-3-glycerol phosphate synthase
MQIRHHQPTQPLTASKINSQVAAQSAKPRHILEEIVRHKQQEVAQMREQLPLADLQNHVSAAPSLRNFLSALWQNPTKPSLIAEVKKASPSKGVIRADFDPVQIAQAYERGGAGCLSVLTDQKFFQGSFDNLCAIRQSIALPLLCKEFIIDPYQIYLARVAGADAVLLIAAILSDGELQEFLQIVHSLGMNALVEVHTLTEFDRVLTLSELRLVGINNRNLEDFTVDLGTTQQLMTERREQLHSLGITVVSESGLHTPADLAVVAKAGVHAVLVGESLVKQTDPEQAVFSLLNSNPLSLSPNHHCAGACEFPISPSPSLPISSMTSISNCLKS